jgi:flagellar assembly protein FliH
MMNMSVKLIKNGDPSAAASFAPFILPSLDDDFAPVQTAKQISSFAPRAAHTEQTHSTREATRQYPAAISNQVNAETLLSEAQAQAEQIIADAQARAAEIERAACEKGLAQARAQIEGELSAGVEDLRAQMAATIERIAGLEAEIFTQAEKNLVHLALEIAKKIVRREVHVDQEIVLTLARVTLARLAQHVVARIHLHPEDYKFIAARADQLGNSVKLIEDAAIERGGCFIHTEIGDFDARLEHQFAEIERGLLLPQG